MGCDIHLHVEAKVNGHWEHYSNPDVQRNYELFAMMAGVRGDATPIALPRGLPEDANRLTRLDAEYHDDGHNHSWLSSEEVCLLAERGAKEFGWKQTWHRGPNPGWETDYFGYFFRNTFWGWHAFPEDRKHLRESGVEDFRFVFWFDS